MAELGGNPSQENSIQSALAAFTLGGERGLLDQIDQLRRCGVDQYVELPQIVVVGDQSAGKSSALAALTGLSFPRSESRCTRFATEIIIRRADQESFLVSIIPAKDRNTVERSDFLKFPELVRGISDFSTIMEHAIDLICSKNPKGKFSTKDTLRIEVSGPKHSHLTLVDLPGFIQSENMHQSKDDVADIFAIAHRYMKSPRTIILAIVSAAYDYPIQPVLKKARALDPTGARTFGVITKPDKAEDTRIDDFVSLALNEDTELKLGLGWHVLRNRSHNEMGISPEEMKRKELEFFSREKWNTLPPSSTGIDNLSLKLSHQLQRHIKENIGDVEREILKELQLCTQRLEILGEGKDTIPEMRSDLIKKCSISKELIKEAVDGHYKNPIGLSFFPRKVSGRSIPARNLRARVVEKNLSFARDIITAGRSIHLTDDTDALGIRPTMPSSSSSGGRKMTKRQYILEVIEPLLKESAGEELLGDSSPLLVFKLFQDYSADWAGFADAHKLEVEKICDEFLVEVVEFVWPLYMRKGLRSAMLNEYVHRRTAGAEAEAKKLHDDRERYVKTYDPEFEERMNKWWKEQASKPDYQYSLPERCLQELLIYYELTSKTFINNVIVQVIERHLLHDLDGIFDMVEVCMMDDETIKLIAEENEQLRHERLALKQKKATLQDGLSICRDIDLRRDLQPLDAPRSRSVDGDPSDEDVPQTPTPSSRGPNPLPKGPSSPSSGADTDNLRGAPRPMHRKLSPAVTPTANAAGVSKPQRESAIATKRASGSSHELPSPPPILPARSNLPTAFYTAPSSWDQQQEYSQPHYLSTQPNYPSAQPSYLSTNPSSPSTTLPSYSPYPSPTPSVHRQRPPIPNPQSESGGTMPQAAGSSGGDYYAQAPGEVDQNRRSRYFPGTRG